jgi:hypothetical protein
MLTCGGDRVALPKGTPRITHTRTSFVRVEKTVKPGDGRKNRIAE